MKKILNSIKNNDIAQGLVEYGLILALVSVVAVGTLGGVGENIPRVFNSVINIHVDQMIEQGYVPVATAEDLVSIGNSEITIFGEGTKWEKEYTPGLDKKYIQVADIDLSDILNWEPIGTGDNPFTGEFDGGSFVISNLTIDRLGTDRVGLFGYGEGSKLINIGLVNAVVKGQDDVGGLIGFQSGSIIVNSYVTGQVSGKSVVGGLVGKQRERSKVSLSYADISVVGKGTTGGLVGSQHRSDIISSYTTGDTFGGGFVGGLIGHHVSHSLVLDSYSESDVSCSLDRDISIGGLVGYQSDKAILRNSYANNKVIGKGNVGGLVGYNFNATAEDSSWVNSHSELRGIGLIHVSSVQKGISGISVSTFNKIKSELFN